MNVKTFLNFNETKIGVCSRILWCGLASNVVNSHVIGVMQKIPN